MIYLVTDRRPGEPEIPTFAFRQPLRITALDGAPIANIQPPIDGWTHERLQQHVERLAQATRAGADAWLGDRWIGSTEC